MCEEKIKIIELCLEDKMSNIIKGREVREGKTKIIFEVVCPNLVLVCNKDDMTTGDGKGHHKVVENKGKLSTTFTCNAFELLKKHGLPVSFIRRVNDNAFLSENLEMIRFELVVRNVATGSYLLRHPEIAEGAVFEDLVFEIYLKDNERHDPLMIFDEENKCWNLFDAKKPLSEGLIETVPMEKFVFAGQVISEGIINKLKMIAKKAFKILSDALSEQNALLVDFKIECGFNFKLLIKIGDVIDLDSCRVWLYGKKENQIDKQILRDLKIVKPEDLEKIEEKYSWGAEMSKKFLLLEKKPKIFILRSED